MAFTRPQRKFAFAIFTQHNRSASCNRPCENAGSLATRENSYFFAAPSHREMVDWTRGTLLGLRWSFESCIVLKFQASIPSAIDPSLALERA